MESGKPMVAVEGRMSTGAVENELPMGAVEWSACVGLPGIEMPMMAQLIRSSIFFLIHQTCCISNFSTHSI